jgi:Ca2+-dependent lipid-binding protein
MAEEAVAVKGTVVVTLKGTKLANRDGWFGTSDPFFVLSKLREDGAVAPCAKSNVVDNNLNPTWAPLRIPLQRLCNGDKNRPLQLMVNDFDKDDKCEEIGHLMVTTAELLTPGWSGKLKHPRGKDKDVGTISVAASQLIQEPSFLECVAFAALLFVVSCRVCATRMVVREC